MMMAINAVTRGVDVDDVAHAVNYDVPKEAGDFAHRVEQAGGPQFMARRQPFAAPGERLLLRRWSARHLYPEISYAPNSASVVSECLTSDGAPHKMDRSPRSRYR
jgi:superfamily II DNA/RNA helicase